MNKHLIIALATSLSLAGLASCGQPQTEVLFNGKDLSGWDVTGKAQVTGNILQLYGPDTRLLLKNGDYTDFELRLEARTVEGGQGSVAFHTDASGKGYSVALDNNRQSAAWWRKTGSLLAVRNVVKSPAKDGEWFDMTIRVAGKSIMVKVNNDTLVEYIEPAAPFRLPAHEQELLSQGTIALTADEGCVEFRSINLHQLDCSKDELARQQANAQDEQADEIIRLHQQDFPVLDYHVHLKGGFTKEAAARQSRRLGINYAIAPNCGIGFPITSDEGVYNFLDSMRTQPFVLAMQGEGREWSTTFSKEAREQFDYVFTDALTFTDRKGRRVRLWIAPEVVIDNNDQEAYMDLIVEKTCDVLKEPADIFVNPFFLPECMNDRYEQFWTDARVDKVIRELVKNGKALEINELYRIPSQRIIMKAKEADVKFTFGSNNVSPEVGKLEYALQMKKACGITAEEMYVPRIK